MILNTDHLNRCIRTLQSSMTLYEQAEPKSIGQEVFRNAIIKGYELTQETAFKLLKKALKDFGHGAKKLDSTPIKEILRLGATHGLMTGRSRALVCLPRQPQQHGPRLRGGFRQGNARPTSRLHRRRVPTGGLAARPLR